MDGSCVIDSDCVSVSDDENDCDTVWSILPVIVRERSDVMESDSVAVRETVFSPV